jgi:putative pyruvate formate lyase activating enzyme
MFCSLCPRKCNIDRTNQIGYCGVNEKIRVARAAPHYWEEPCISGKNGSGTVFFSGCNLGCVFCQNYQLSHEAFGKDVTEYELMKIFDNLINKGVHNINLVTPTHYSHVLSKVLKEFNSPVPIVYNTSSYEAVDALKELDGLVDIYLPDIKYYDNEPALKYSKAKDYFLYASEAVKEMYRQVGDLIIDDNGIAQRGILIRHMLLPGNISQAVKIFNWVADNLSLDTYISVMRQYTPYGEAKNMSPIDRPITAKEYKIAKQKIEEIGFENIYFQKKSSSDEIFIPDFNLEGVENL